MTCVLLPTGRVRGFSFQVQIDTGAAGNLRSYPVVSRNLSGRLESWQAGQTDYFQVSI